jgi:hypothetical protein
LWINHLESTKNVQGGESKALVRTERQEHAAGIKELNTYVRDREIEHIETLNNLSTIMQSIDDKMEKLNTML